MGLHIETLITSANLRACQWRRTRLPRLKVSIIDPESCVGKCPVHGTAHSEQGDLVRSRNGPYPQPPGLQGNEMGDGEDEPVRPACARQWLIVWGMLPNIMHYPHVIDFSAGQDPRGLTRSRVFGKGNRRECTKVCVMTRWTKEVENTWVLSP